MSAEPTLSRQPRKVVGRYALYDEIAAGGMATVHLGRLMGPVGFSRTVAIKRLHPHYAKDPEFSTMFLDEARLAARIRHPNVVQTLDVVALEGELFLVMDYVQGESVSQLVRAAKARGERIPPAIVASIVSGALQGLHAAHEAKSERGEMLGIVHRDVSPQNILVDVDGVARVLDFGVAKAIGRAQTTRDGQIKGKLAYMSPEQILGGKVTRQTDVWAASVVLWEALTSRRLFGAENQGETMRNVLQRAIEAPSSIVPGLPAALDAVVARGLERDEPKRWSSALEMAVALESAMGLVSSREVGAWVQAAAGETLTTRALKVAEIEGMSAVLGAGSSSRPPSRAPSSPPQHTRELATQVSPPPPTRLDPPPIDRGAPVSQISSISVSSMSAAGLGPRRRGWVIGASALGLVIVGATVAWRAGSTTPPRPSAVAAPVVSLPSAAADVVLPTPAPIEPPPAASASTPAPVVSAPVVSAPASRPTTPPPQRATPRTTAPQAPPKKTGGTLYSRD